MIELGFYKVHPAVKLPAMATGESACFDIAMSMEGKMGYEGFNRSNGRIARAHHNGGLFIGPHERIMVPTGLILDIPWNYSVRIHARSGLSIKNGLTLVNAEGVIDADYTEELFILLHNTSEVGYMIQNGERIAQGEMVERLTYNMKEITERPAPRANRTGGMGSTGTQSFPEKQIAATNAEAPAEKPRRLGWPKGVKRGPWPRDENGKIVYDKNYVRPTVSAEETT